MLIKMYNKLINLITFRKDLMQLILGIEKNLDIKSY